MRARRWVAVIWLCFLARGFFYCAALPIWEGYDEWAHFAVVERMAFHGEALVSRASPAPRDVAASLQLAPVAWECRYLLPPSVTQDDFWRLPEAERARREAEFHAIPGAWAREDSSGPLKAYEGLQGPLAGWLMTPVLWAASGAQLATQVLLLRWFGIAVVSLAVPLGFLIGRRIFGEDAPALGCAAIIAAMPGFAINIARVSNESVAVMLFTALIWLALEEAQRPRPVLLGAVLGLGLLAKAYFLTAIPPLGLWLAWKCRRPRTLLAPVVAGAIAGWWYVRNLVTTGTVSGMWESAAMPGAGLGAQLRHAAGVPWVATVDSIMVSHLWQGAWSTLTLRSWMYHLLYVLIAAALVGLLWRRPQGGILLVAFYVTFWLGQLFHANLLSMVWGIATSLGCYLYAVVGAEVPLCVAGLRALAPGAARRYVAAVGVALLALLDLYSLNMVAIPYYTGFIAHRANGPVAAFHPTWASLSEILPRLAMFKAPMLTQPVLAALWIFYVGATIALAIIAARRETSR